MLESFKTDKFEYQRLTPEEQEKRGILGRLVGVIADTTGATRNGRKYGLDLWKKVFSDPIMQEKIKNRTVFSELGHPEDRSETDMSKICACLSEQPKIGKDGKLYGVFDILNTPNGKILKTMCDYGTTVGVSSRGTGDIITDYDGNEAVDPDTYECECFDIVLLPAVESARMQYVTESYKGKTLKQALNEEYNRASEEDKKVMKETFEMLEIEEPPHDILSIVEDHFGTVEELYFGPTFILPNGKFLNLQEEAHHSAVEKFLIDSGLSNKDFIETAGSQTLYELGCIRVDALKYYIALSPIQPTREQYNSLLLWLDYLQTSAKVVEVISPDDQHVVYSFNDYISDYIVDRIRRYYSSGTLYEKLNQRHAKNFMYKRNLIGEGIESASIDTGDQVIKIEVENKDSQLSPVDIDIDELSVADEEAEGETEEAENFGTEEVVESLQKSLRKNHSLEKRIEELQTQLSVSNAKEVKLNEEVEKYKQSTQRLSNKVKEVKELKESISQLETKIQTQQKRISTLNEKLKNSSEESNHLNETVQSKSKEIFKLSRENKRLSESLEESSKREQLYSDKLQRAKELVEKYKKSVQSVSDRYIEMQAKSHGLSAEQINNQLSESYTLKDVDRICEALTSQNLRISKLPFDVSKNIRVTTESKREPILGESKNADDDLVDESLLRLANL